MDLLLLYGGEIFDSLLGLLWPFPIFLITSSWWWKSRLPKESPPILGQDWGLVITQESWKFSLPTWSTWLLVTMWFWGWWECRFPIQSLLAGAGIGSWYFLSCLVRTEQLLSTFSSIPDAPSLVLWLELAGYFGAGVALTPCISKVLASSTSRLRHMRRLKTEEIHHCVFLHPQIPDWLALSVLWNRVILCLFCI